MSSGMRWADTTDDEDYADDHQEAVQETPAPAVTTRQVCLPLGQWIGSIA